MDKKPQQINIVIDKTLLEKGENINLKVTTSEDITPMNTTEDKHEMKSENKYSRFLFWRKNKNAKKTNPQNNQITYGSQNTFESENKEPSENLIVKQVDVDNEKSTNISDSKTNNKSNSENLQSESSEPKNKKRFSAFSIFKKSREEHSKNSEEKITQDKSLNSNENSHNIKSAKENSNQEIKDKQSSTKSEKTKGANHPKVNGKPSYPLFVLSFSVFLIIAGFEIKDERFADAIFFIFLGITLSANWLYFKYLSLLERLIMIISALASLAIFIIILLRDTITFN